MTHRILFALLALGAPMLGVAQDIKPPPLGAFCPGESHELEVTYLGIPGLHVLLEVLPPENLDGRQVFRARGVARASALVGLFFKINDSVETWMDPEGVFTRKFRLVQDESKIKREAIETFDPVRQEAVYENHSQKKGEDLQHSRAVTPVPASQLSSFSGQIQDTLSAFYYLRSLPLAVGTTFMIPVMSEGRVLKVGATVISEGPARVNGSRQNATVVRLSKMSDAPTGENSSAPVENIIYLSAGSQRTLLEFSVYSRFGHITASLKNFHAGSCSAN